MLGVELKATWSRTRKANGDICQARVGDTIRQWKSGKFMHMNMRSWSLNQYCLPKIWFRTHSVDLRVQDVTKITSLIKSWLYQDQFLKPEELVMHRHPSVGGLGIHNVLIKAQAGLIKTFLETATNSKFRGSLFHTILFRYHILGDTSLPNPGFPPFYSADFFSKIRQVHDETPLNVATMSEGQWYQLFLQDNCTMEEGDGDQRKLIMCRVERSKPEVDWERSWRLARMPGLGPENVSFLFKLVHQILPTQERVARTSARASPACPVRGCDHVCEDLAHAIVLSQGNDGVGHRMMSCVREFSPRVGIESALRLDFDVEEDMELPLVWLIATVSLEIWKLRVDKSRVQLYDVRAQLEAKINLLRETRFTSSTILLDQFDANYFQKIFV